MIKSTMDIVEQEYKTRPDSSMMDEKELEEFKSANLKYGNKKWVAADDEIIELEKHLQRLKGYACGYHKQLEKQIQNHIKKLKFSQYKSLEKKE